ncbi:MAG TPA: glycosyltransferase family A protein, partial [Solirubrobacter sp.]
MTPRVVLAAPIYRGEAHLEQAVRSLLAQTETDFRLLLVDDASTDGTVPLARALAAEDPRIEVHVNERRLGMLGNTQRAWALAAERCPEAPYVALASDHDVWAPEWLAELVGALEGAPEAVLAYPLTTRIDAAGEDVPGLRTWRCSTAGIADPYRRLRRSYRCMVAGDMIYGLMRADAFARAGSYQAVLVPDRLLLSRLALEGEFIQVERLLWRRRFVGLADLER